MSDDTEARLAFAKFTGSLTGRARIAAEAFPGYTCYKDFTGGHFWIQRFNSDGTLWLLHGRDSVLPGLDIPQCDPSDLRGCNCGAWMPPTKEQMRNSRALAQDVVLANRGVN